MIWVKIEAVICIDIWDCSIGSNNLRGKRKRSKIAEVLNVTVSIIV